MYCLSETANKITAKKSKTVRLMALAALAVCVLFVAVSFFSSAYILKHANHKHDHNGANNACTTCAGLNAAANLLEQISVAAVKTKTFAIVFCLFTVLSLPRSYADNTNRSSLVTLKVQLNN